MADGRDKLIENIASAIYKTGCSVRGMTSCSESQPSTMVKYLTYLAYFLQISVDMALSIANMSF